LVEKSVATDPLIGTRLGDYTIQSLIGRGGMARVYEGIDEKLGRRAAIKVMQVIQEEHSEQLTQRFIREARAVATLDHPNIVGIYQFGEGADLYYMAMKYIEGYTLQSLLKTMRRNKQYLHPSQISLIINQVAEALDYAHSKGVIHRDIKPSNIMLTDDNRAILTDFGLTMQLGADSTLGTAFGTPRYIAPEQAVSSSKAVPQSDIYALGVVLYEMATGQAPFDDDSAMSLALRHITTPPPAPRTVREDLPPAVETVILKALEKRPENRWQTAAAMAAALAQAYQNIAPNVVITNEELDISPSAKIMGKPQKAVEPRVRDNTSVMSSRSLAQWLARARPGAPRQLPRVWLAVPLLMIAAFGGAIYLVLAQKPAPPPAVQMPAEATVAPRVRLIYTKDAFVIYNATGQTISLEGVTFIRDDPTSRPFEAAQFGDRAHKALPAGQCLQIRMRSTDERSIPQMCGPQTKPLILDSSIIFWSPRSDKDQVSTFLVNRTGKTLQTCSMRLNTCEFSLS